MNLAMLLAADYATVDASGKLNILGAFTNIYTRQFPATHALMHLVMKFHPSLGEYGDTRTLRIVLVDEDGRQLHEFSSDFKVPSLESGHRPEFNAIIAFRDLEFSHAGRYEFRIFIDKEQKGDLTLDLIQIESHQPQE